MHSSAHGSCPVREENFVLPGPLPFGRTSCLGVKSSAGAVELDGAYGPHGFDTLREFALTVKAKGWVAEAS